MPNVPHVGLIVAALAVGGCAASKQDALETRVTTLEAEVKELREENRQLRARLDGLKPAASSTVAATTPLPTCKKKSEQHYTLTVAQKDQIVGNLARLNREARMIPFFKNGKSAGFKLYSIKSGSTAASCGFKNGDVLVKINGDVVDSPERTLEAYSKAKGRTEAHFEIVRQGQTLELTVSLED